MPAGETSSSARAGEIVGPLSQDDGFVLLAVQDKVLPAADDAEVCRRAAASLLDRAIEHEVAQRVKWHRRL